MLVCCRTVAVVNFALLVCFREDGPHRLLFIDKMIDDRTDYGTSYYEFLTHVSRQLSKINDTLCCRLSNRPDIVGTVPI